MKKNGWIVDRKYLENEKMDGKERWELDKDWKRESLNCITGRAYYQKKIEDRVMERISWSEARARVYELRPPINPPFVVAHATFHEL